MGRDPYTLQRASTRPTRSPDPGVHQTPKPKQITGEKTLLYQTSSDGEGPLYFLVKLRAEGQGF